MWRWPEWMSAFWLGRLAPLDDEHGTWRGMKVGRLATHGGPAHPAFVAPAFASHEQRPRDLEPLAMAASVCVVRPRGLSPWPRGLLRWGAMTRATGQGDVLVHARNSLSSCIAKWWSEESFVRCARNADYHRLERLVCRIPRTLIAHNLFRLNAEFRYQLRVFRASAHRDLRVSKRPRHQDLDCSTCPSSPNGIRLRDEIAGSGSLRCSTLGAGADNGCRLLPRAAREGQRLRPR